jgi:hypothetical protein
MTSNTDSFYIKIQTPWRIVRHLLNRPVSFKMKLSSALLLLAAALVSAAPTPTIEESADKILVKRASITDAANVGYATQNGG